VWVGLGIDHCSSQTSRNNEETSSNGYDNGGPGREEWVDVENTLLSSVGEVVVSAAHVIERTSLVHSDEASIEVSAGSVELHAVLWVSLDGIVVVVVLLLQVGQRKAVGLSELAHPDSEFLGFEESSVTGDPVVRSWLRVFESLDLNHVGSVSLFSSFSCISSGVGVTTSPLEVNVVSGSSSEVGGDKVVFSGWVGLDNVSSLSSDVEVEDSLEWGHSRGSGANVEDVRSVLEGSSELRSVKGKRNIHSVLSQVGILLDRGVLGIGSPVNEASIRSVSRRSKISSGNVVSESEDTVAVIVLDALQIL